MKRYLEARRRAIAERPRIIEKYLEDLASALQGRASIIVFGGRAAAGIESREPRDLDVLIVVSDDDDPQAVEELAYKLKPRTLPVDVIVARRSELSSPLAKQMLKTRITVHDPLRVEEELRGACQAQRTQQAQQLGTQQRPSQHS